MEAFLQIFLLLLQQYKACFLFSLKVTALENLVLPRFAVHNLLH
uniref:Uncharacterized protein n=2 Tax=unclassified Caudoviricetes TaxID=2788787 RepID=A0A8S5PHS1_9CAUD|nr:MAG TPA: hypothetical protein [Siphoviridae sp. ctJcm18]DAE06622.1 MAG TPA: hypothetical protein [Siphoviridae sp. ctUGQ45]